MPKGYPRGSGPDGDERPVGLVPWKRATAIIYPHQGLWLWCLRLEHEGREMQLHPADELPGFARVADCQAEALDLARTLRIEIEKFQRGAD